MNYNKFGIDQNQDRRRHYYHRDEGNDLSDRSYQSEDDYRSTSHDLDNPRRPGAAWRDYDRLPRTRGRFAHDYAYERKYNYHPSVGYGSFYDKPELGRPKDFRGRGPKGYQRSDRRIYDEVCETLEYDRHIDASEIDVQVADGVVTLSGTVESRQTKRHAEDIIEHINGVTDVRNQLSVEPPSKTAEPM